MRREALIEVGRGYIDLFESEALEVLLVFDLFGEASFLALDYAEAVEWDAFVVGEVAAAEEWVAVPNEVSLEYMHKGCDPIFFFDCKYRSLKRQYLEVLLWTVTKHKL